MKGQTGLTGIILVGGASSRFGSDKASAPFLGRRMLDWVVDAAGAACDSLVVVCAPGAPRPAVGPTVPVCHTQDSVPGQGPLAGLVAGLEASTTSLCFAASCDAPLLQPALIIALAALADGWDAVCPRVNGRLQPLTSVYRATTALAPLRDALSHRRLRIAATLEQLRVRVVDEHELRLVDPQLDSFRTANTPEELALIERYALQ
jgi:molybdopterin-guanine dinucleotide biosynthesis protein A